MADKPEAGVITTEVACQLLMLSRQRLDQLVSGGWLNRIAPGRWRTVDVVQGYIRFLRDEDRRSSKSGADSRVRDARAKEIEQRVGLRAGDLMLTETHDDIVSELVGLFRAELAGLPARVTRDLQERGKIEQVVYEILERLAERAREKAASVVTDSGTTATVAATDTGSVGG